MGIDRMYADLQLVRYLLAQFASGNQIQYLHFTLGQDRLALIIADQWRKHLARNRIYNLGIDCKRRHLVGRNFQYAQRQPDIARAVGLQYLQRFGHTTESIPDFGSIFPDNFYMSEISVTLEYVLDRGYRRPNRRDGPPFRRR